MCTDGFDGNGFDYLDVGERDSGDYECHADALCDNIIITTSEPEVDFIIY